MNVKEFLCNWLGDFIICNEEGSVITEFREYMDDKLLETKIKDIRYQKEYWTKDRICIII